MRSLLILAAIMAMAFADGHMESGEAEAEWAMAEGKRKSLPGPIAGCLTVNGGKLNRSQAEPGQALSFAVVYFPSIS